MNFLTFFEFEAKFGTDGPDQIMAVWMVFVFLPIVFHQSKVSGNSLRFDRLNGHHKLLSLRFLFVRFCLHHETGL